jgi:hypothetical protein
MNQLRYKLAMALARAIGFKPFYFPEHPSQPVWAKTQAEAQRELSALRFGDCTSRLLPLWIKAIRGF